MRQFLIHLEEKKEPTKVFFCSVALIPFFHPRVRVAIRVRVRVRVRGGVRVRARARLGLGLGLGDPNRSIHLSLFFHTEGS